MAQLRKKEILVVLTFCFALLLVTLFLTSLATAPSFEPAADSDTQTKTSEEKSAESFDISEHSLSKPESLWVIVNKKRPLQSSYVPNSLIQPDVPSRSVGSSESLLRKDAALATEKLFKSAVGAGHELLLVSGYRSYSLQSIVYANNVSREGRVQADKTSARPGHSEHQTGLAVDIGLVSRKCELQTCFGNTPEGKWIAENAHLYGFIIRYPKNMESTVGFTYEPWHLRYVGESLSQEIYKANVTLEDFFNLEAAPDY